MASASITEETEGMIMFLIASKDEEPRLAKEAFEEFIRRHRDYLYRCCKRMEDSKLGFKLGLSAEELAKETLARVWGKASTYKPLENASPSQQRWRTRAWMGRVANNLFVDRIRRSPEHLIDDGPIDNVAAPSQLTSGLPERERDAVLDAWESLTEREQIVLHATERYYRSGAKQQRLPNDVSKRLAQSLDCTSDGVRQIRLRARRKMKKLLRDKGFRDANYEDNDDD